MDWTLADIRTKVRKLTGRPGTNQLSNTDLDDAINSYYTLVLPFDLSAHEFDGFTEYTTVAGTGETTLASDVLTVSGTVTIKDSDDVVYPVELYTDINKFFEIYPEDDNDEADERDQPAAILVYGRVVYIRPVPDEVYTLKFASISQEPTDLTATDQSPSDKKWGPLIAYSASIEILQEAGEDDEASRLFDLRKFHLTSCATKQVKQFPLGMRGKPRF